MESSEEIRRVVERFTRAEAEAEHDSVLARLSEHPGSLIVGTDPAEWWRGRETQAVWGGQLRELGVRTIHVHEIEAWEEGSVGWAAAKQTMTWEGKPSDVRVTYVLHLERGEWKIVHIHWSVPSANAEVLGRSLPVTLEEVEKAVQRERPNLSRVESEGTVTLAFTDIVDSTVLVARLGDEAWLDLVQRHNLVIRETTAAHGGTVVEVQGDGSMLAFPSARSGVACACAIQREMGLAFAAASVPIRVRIGVHTGDALHDTDHFFGTTVHYAARVASHALGGEVLVSSVVHDLVASSKLAFHESREVELKGLDGLHRLYSLDLTSESTFSGGDRN